MAGPILIYAAQRSSRLIYVLDWIFKERLNLDYQVVDSAATAMVSYGHPVARAVNIPCSGLLYETGISRRDIKLGTWETIPTFFAENAGEVPFDFFSAVFFLISRYEEYYAFTPDKHGRYPATNSILFEMNCLERPLADEWIERFRKLLEGKFGLTVPPRKFSFLPTYDIDIAWSYKHKGIARNIGGFLKDVASFNIRQLGERLSVTAGNAQDPYDSFDFIQSLHWKLGYRPVYFILAALQTGQFDKNISPLNPAMQKLINELASDGKVGMHPSYDTESDEQRFGSEKSALEKTTGNTIAISRQHYIRMKLPSTYRNLVSRGIGEDYSMGYGTHLGFRAGTGSSFLWYDIEKETVTDLRVHPFCFMDSTAHYENHLAPEAAFESLSMMADILRATHSTLITVFHNFSLGTSAEWKGWPKMYATFLEKMKQYSTS